MENRGILANTPSGWRFVSSNLREPRRSLAGARRGRAAEQSPITFGEQTTSLPSHDRIGRLTVYLDSRMVAVEGQPIELSSKEYGLLEILLRRGLAGRSQDAIIRTGKLSLNLNTHRVEIDGRPVRLTNKEYAIIEILSLRKGTAMTKVMLLEHLYDRFDEPEIKIIDVFICKLRKKLAELSGGETFIETLRGQGYVLRDPQEAAA